MHPRFAKHLAHEALAEIRIAPLCGPQQPGKKALAQEMTPLLSFVPSNFLE